MFRSLNSLGLEGSNATAEVQLPEPPAATSPLPHEAESFASWSTEP